MRRDDYEPHLLPVEIGKLRPTQMTVGLLEVRAKQQAWKETGAIKRENFFAHHMVPVVVGPKERLYVVDHHHLLRALLAEGVVQVLTSTVADLSHLQKDEFWSVMDHRSLVYPFDENGRRCPIADLPKAIQDLKDDPFRSLAGAVRGRGGYAKIDALYSEFCWADFFRRRLERSHVEKSFDLATDEAVRLAHAREASHLPGWCGPKA